MAGLDMHEGKKYMLHISRSVRGGCFQCNCYYKRLECNLLAVHVNAHEWCGMEIKPPLPIFFYISMY